MTLINVRERKVARNVLLQNRITDIYTRIVTGGK